MSARHIVSGTTPTFRLWVSNRDLGGLPDGSPHEGMTGLADEDIKIYAAAPGDSLPGSPISDTHYSWTERDRGHYDIAFSDATYFTGSGPSAVSIEFDDGVYTWPVGEIFYVVGNVPAEVRSMAAAVLTNTAIANNAISNVKFDTGAIDDLVLASDCITASKIANNAIDRATFAQDAKDLFGELRRNTAQSGTASTIVLDASASAVDDFYNGALVVIASGTGAGQFRTVSDYVGSTKTVTPDRDWTTNPDNTSVFVIIAATSPSASLGAGSIAFATLASDLTTALGIVRRNTAQSGSTSTTLKLDASASASDDFYNGMSVFVASGTGALQERTIIDYVGFTKVATIDHAWDTTPDNTSVFIVRAGAPALAGIAREVIEGTVLEDSSSLGDLIRLLVSVEACKVSDFVTGTLVFKSMDGTKTRVTVTTDETGRLTFTKGDLSA